MPENVRTTILSGKKEYFTDTSKLPVIKPQIMDNNQIQF